MISGRFGEVGELIFEIDLIALDGEIFPIDVLMEMRSRLGKIIKPEEDSILFFPLCACCRGKIERIGGIAPADRSIFFA